MPYTTNGAEFRYVGVDDGTTDSRDAKIYMLERELDEVKQKLDLFTIRKSGEDFFLQVRTKVGVKEVQIT